jgi:hypothetical protein
MKDNKDIIALMEAYTGEVDMQQNKNVITEKFSDIGVKLDEIVNELQVMLKKADTPDIGDRRVKNKIRSLLIHLEPIRRELM